MSHLFGSLQVNQIRLFLLIKLKGTLTLDLMRMFLFKQRKRTVNGLNLTHQKTSSWPSLEQILKNSFFKMLLMQTAVTLLWVLIRKRNRNT